MSNATSQTTTPTSEPFESDSDNTYSKPEGGLFCILGPGGRMVINPNGQAYCFESQAAAEDFASKHPELTSDTQIQEVFVKGRVHGWESVPAEAVDENQISETLGNQD